MNIFLRKKEVEEVKGAESLERGRKKEIYFIILLALKY